MSELNDFKFVRFLFLMWSWREKDRKGGWSEEKEAGKVGKALYVSSKRQLKKTSRNKSSEYSVQNCLHEASSLFYLEFGSLECPGEIGVSFFGGAERK